MFKPTDLSLLAQRHVRHECSYGRVELSDHGLYLVHLLVLLLVHRRRDPVVDAHEAHKAEEQHERRELLARPRVFRIESAELDLEDLPLEVRGERDDEDVEHHAGRAEKELTECHEQQHDLKREDDQDQQREQREAHLCGTGRWA